MNGYRNPISRVFAKRRSARFQFPQNSSYRTACLIFVASRLLWTASRRFCIASRLLVTASWLFFEIACFCWIAWLSTQAFDDTPPPCTCAGGRAGSAIFAPVGLPTIADIFPRGPSFLQRKRLEILAGHFQEITCFFDPFQSPTPKRSQNSALLIVSKS